MKAIALDYAASAVMLNVYHDSSENTLHSFTIEKLSDRLQTMVNVNFDIDRTRKVVRIIEHLGVGRFYEDAFADPIFQISDDAIYRFFTNRADPSDIYGRSWNLGIEWLQTAFEKEVFWRELDKEPVELGSLLPPQGDDLFPIDHNSAAFKKASELLDELLAGLEKGNDVGDMSLEDIATAKAEVSEIRSELSKGEVTFPAFGFKVRSSLGWIAKQAAGAIVGAIALAAIAAIFDLVRIPF